MPVERALQALGFSAREAVTETTALFAHVVGLLLSLTGRIRMFSRAPDELFANYLDALIQGAPRPRRGAAK